ncbi:MAG TPA: DUF6252 family protein [Longimicrobiaceae bacterium]|nr:DUF6252 family protein [Longimicrobiaceae bacterium]
MPVSHRFRGYALLLVAALVAACAGDSPTGSEQDPFVTARVNGAAWRANYQVDLAVADLMQQGRLLEVVGLQVNQDGSTQQVSVVIPDYAGPGTYPLRDPDPQAGAFGFYVTRASRTAEPVAYFTDAQHTGTITVAKMDQERRQVSGTFSFRARQENGTAVVEVAGGEFRGRYVPQ